jgi:hypothetical protein
MKKHFLYSLYSLAFVAALFSCQKQKDLPAPVITEPRFYVNCEMDGQVLDLEAGNEAYYMNSSWYYQDSNSMFVYKANLAKQIGSGYQITILINDIPSSSSSAFMKPDSTLFLGSHLFDDQNKSGLERIVSFEPLNSYDPNSSFSWSVSDGTTTNTYGEVGVENMYSISTMLQADKTYTVTYSYEDGSGTCSEKLTNVFKAGSDLQTTITASKDMTSPDSKYLFGCTTLKPGNFDYLWTFDDATTSIAANPSKIFGPGVSLVKLNLTDKNTGESCTSNYQVNSNNSCEANYRAIFQPIHNSRLYSSVTVLLIDPNGVVYSSHNIVQPQESNFEIVSVGNYKNNDNNEPTKTLDVRFNCVVKNGGKEIILRNAKAKIAVAYK